ncbi:hypothetical protein ACTJJ0_05700 [Chitinophaga sp. 22321]|uniref:Lipoprotein n=1 Tax=Chitinophaga hostae TaxID=2831022 RepID=A0ABS5IZ52_9BACT|nr:hypothetical protein [Chitinophaga hostae]MBS0028248.1 hypothetical protein [Chitinophaga hostae]
MKISILLALSMLIIFSSCGDRQNNTLAGAPANNKASAINLTPPSVGIKLTAFKNVEELQDKLSENGIGVLRRWRGDEIGWMSSSDYFSFGLASNDNGMRNNLAYYLESDNENYVRTVKLVLNINNAAEKGLAINQFKKIVKNTFKSVQLEMPKGIFDGFQYGKEFQATNKNFITSISLDKSKIDTWKLTIETK